MKRLLLLAMLLILGVALFNITNVCAATENSQTADNTINQTIELNNTTGLGNYSNIQNTTGNTANISVNPVNNPSTNNLQNLQNSSNSSDNEKLNNSNSNITDMQDSKDAAGDDIYQNVRGIWLKAEDVSILNLDEIKGAGITDIFVKSNMFTVPTYQNVLTALLDKLKNTNIRVHAWITCFKDADGNWINPQGKYTYTYNGEVFTGYNTSKIDALITSIVNIARNYDIDGIHLDYVRYPGTAYKNSGSTETITAFVKNVRDAVKQIKPKMAISAALMPEGADNAYYYGQDYTKLAPYLDFIVPMIYKGNYRKDTVWIGSTTKWIVDHTGGKPVIAGLQTYESDSNITAIPADELNSDINSALNSGASGYVLFRYGLINNSFFSNSQNTTTFTVNQIKVAASNVRAYVESKYRLPDYVSIGTSHVTMSQFLELLTSALLQINNGNNNAIPLESFGNAVNPKEDITAGNMLKAEYLKIASDVKNYMDSSGKAPDYAYGTSIGNYLGFQNLVYMYSMVLDYYNTSGKMADWATMKPWTTITGQTPADPNTTTFTVNQIKVAASAVRTYVDANNKLPNYVSIGTSQVSMSQFLELLTSALLQINNGNNNAIPLESFGNAVNPKEDITAGNMLKAEYLKIASDVKNYMDSSGKAPDYAYGTSIGNYLGFQNLVYMYSMVLDYYNTSGKMADWATMKPWTTITGQTPADPNTTTFTVNQIKVAASAVRTYVDANNKLPNYVSIGTSHVTMSQFLELLTSALLQINNGIKTPVVLKSIDPPSDSSGDLVNGTINKAELLNIAQNIKSFIDSNGIAPNYATSSLGKIQYESTVYMMAKVLDFYNTNNRLPNYSTVEPFKVNSVTVPNDLQKYLVATANCQIDDYRIKALASSLTNGAGSTYNKGVKIFNWVRDNLNYSFYYNTKYGAVNTYLNKEGNCVDHSHLLIALARTAGIPARYMHGTCTFTSGNVYGHIWAQLYINGRWYDADAISSRNTFGVINNWDRDTAIMEGTYSELPF